MKLSGWRHSSTWIYLVMLFSSVAALFISFILSAETLQLARNPQNALACDVNSVVSCSTVANSWQAEFIKFAGLSFPNAFFGIAAESVFVTVAVLGLSRVKLPKWFTIAAWIGNLFAFAYALWLFSQSVFVIEALCPWCMGLLLSTFLQVVSHSHGVYAIQGIPSSERNAKILKSYFHLNIDLLIDLIIFLVLAAIVVSKYGAVLLS
ncbi:vitamin K epoxide reductase family protein [Alloscardovia theropitheci]|uniref:Vitamin K epoxide reductase family protein n=1 Tax=Alloscardovia theropitheci TaxID=2496842 RepID=A0A4V2MU27_9BIFI|nr:vitamin K epoxide reductase family protein [Alloscardovia theropitheci]TCD54719.1 vitamin K epoxide reductase family protein [Alloscardovia theropitheci]